MQLKSAALDQIARFICGDASLPFPYRSSSQLTTFFTGLGLDYIHRGETRNAWTRDAVIDINSRASKSGIFPSEEIVAVIEEVMNPIYFEGFEPGLVDYDAALSMLNRVLQQYKLEVAVDPVSGVAQLRSIDGQFVSTAHGSAASIKKLTFAPKVFDVPDAITVQHDLAAIMMPFGAAFSPVYDAIKAACVETGLRCKRADDIWANSAILQDIVDLIFVAEIVVVDFTGKNPNVMYETGIAHTLGKHVVPITQSLDDVPFDLQSHRVLKYLPNREGLATLSLNLSDRLGTIVHGHSWDE